MPVINGPSSTEQTTSTAQFLPRQSGEAKPLHIPNRHQPLRIGLFTESYPPVVNGVTTSVLTLIEQLEKQGHTVFVFAPRFPGHTGDPENVIRFPSILTKFDRGYPLPLPFSRDLLASVARYNLDIIHSQVPFLLGLVALMVSRAEGKPLVATNHTLYTEYSHYIPVLPEGFTKSSIRSMVRWYYERCDAVIAPSKMAADRLSQGYDIHKTSIRVVPTGIPMPRIVSNEEKAQVRAAYRVGENDLMLLFAGRIAKEKNLGMLLDSFEKVIAPNNLSTKLVLAGSGVDADSIQERIDQSSVLRNRVIMTGFLHRPDLDPLYAAADLFVFPSTTETQGVVLGEALAAGTPCCAVDAAGSPETVTHGADGILTPNDAKAFGEAILWMLSDKELMQRMSEKAVILAEERTPDKMAAKVVNVYRAALKRVSIRRAGRFGRVMHVAPAPLLRKRIFIRKKSTNDRSKRFRKWLGLE